MTSNRSTTSRERASLLDEAAHGATDDSGNDACAPPLRATPTMIDTSWSEGAAADDIDPDQSTPTFSRSFKHDKLSSEDFVELTRISDKKDDIEHYIADTQSWPVWNPFKGVSSYSTEPKILSASKLSLEEISQDLRLRQDRCELLERDIQRFNVDDMKRLRKVAKAISKRQLSGPDTDLLELALSTIYALDRLLRLLRDQKAEHELTELRLRWERVVLSSWEDVAVLRSDIQAFERKCRSFAAALGQNHDVSAIDEVRTHLTHKNSAPAAHRPHADAKRLENLSSALKLAAESIKLESSRLILRIRSFDAEKVRLAGRLLDLLIDHRQVPEKLLDEQEKLEDALPRPTAIEAEAAQVATVLAEKLASSTQMIITESSSKIEPIVDSSRPGSEAIGSSSHSDSSRRDRAAVSVSLPQIPCPRAWKAELSPTTSTSSPKHGRRAILNRYQADPRNKLDTAIGHIVNRLPILISIRSVQPTNDSAPPSTDTERDVSGRYWIGDPEPRLCFCRILPSRTVMVRVGGGWQELSEFLTQHFQHLNVRRGHLESAMLTPSPGRPGSSLSWLRSASGPVGSPRTSSLSSSLGSPRSHAPTRHGTPPQLASRIVTMPADLTKHAVKPETSDKTLPRAPRVAPRSLLVDHGDATAAFPDRACSLSSSGSSSSIVIHRSPPSL